MARKILALAFLFVFFFAGIAFAEQEARIASIVLDPSKPDTGSPLNIFVKAKSFESTGSSDFLVHVTIKETMLTYDLTKTINAGETADFLFFNFLTETNWPGFKEGKVYTVVATLKKCTDSPCNFNENSVFLNSAEASFGMKMQQKSVPEASPFLAVVVLVFVLGFVYWKKARK